MFPISGRLEAWELEDQVLKETPDNHKIRKLQEDLESLRSENKRLIDLLDQKDRTISDLRRTIDQYTRHNQF